MCTKLLCIYSIGTSTKTSLKKTLIIGCYVWYEPSQNILSLESSNSLETYTGDEMVFPLVSVVRGLDMSMLLMIDLNMLFEPLPGADAVLCASKTYKLLIGSVQFMVDQQAHFC